MTERETTAAAQLAWHALRFSGTELKWSTPEEFYRTGQVTGYTGSVQALRELSNYKLCQELLRARLEQGAPVNSELVRDVHRTLTEHSAISGPDGGNAGALSLLAAATGERDALRDAAVFLLRFQVLRPFRDGNAMTARTLMNYRLALRGEPPILLCAEDKAELNVCLAAEEPEALAAFLRGRADALALYAQEYSFEKGAEMIHEL